MSRGGPSKYRPDIVAKITDALAVHATHKLAAAYAGIDDSTFCAWLLKYPAFVAAVREAEGRAGVKCLAIIHKAAPEDWHAAAWLQERRYPDQYGRTVQTQEHTGKDGAPISFIEVVTPYAESVRTDGERGSSA